jgi:hypothetical protein
MTATSPPSLSCPRCGQIDQVRKVSAVYASGTSTTSIESSTEGVGVTLGGSVGVGHARTLSRGSRHNALSLKLAPPARPSHSGNGNAEMTLGVVLLGVGAIIAIVSASQQNEYGGLLYAPILLVGAISLLAAILKRTKWNREIPQQLSIWQGRMDNWNRLYYCMRDDIVFYPGESRCASVDEMATLLWRKSGTVTY